MADFPMCHDHYSTNSKFKVSVFSVTLGPFKSIKQIVRMFYDPWHFEFSHCDHVLYVSKKYA